MPTWPPKDPDSKLDFVYTIPLDAEDSVSDFTFTKLAGDVVVETPAPALAAAPATNLDGVYGQDVTVWLSGGLDGELAVFYVEWETAAGRIDDDLILLEVIEDAGDLALTGYAKPAPGHLIMRYPAFAAVPQATIRYWLVDAERGVGTSWIEGDYAAGLMALAAHNMALAGLGTDAAALGGIPAGITTMKSGTLSLSFTEQAANARLGGGFGSTRYGAEYMILLRRNRGGPLVTPTGVLPTGINGAHYQQGWG